MKIAVLGVLAAFIGFMPAFSFAASQSPDLVRPPVFGTVREVLGRQLPVVTPRVNCPSQRQPVVGGPCFDSPAFTSQIQQVLAIRDAEDGDRIAGEYGRDFQLYDVSMEGGVLSARPVVLETSDVRVPRDCYALKDEGVAYLIAVRDGAATAQESQHIVCGGGADTPTGPYTPQGLALTSQDSGWPRTERRLAEGLHRYLAVPDKTCPEAFRPRKTHCAKPAVLHMDANPGLKELDLIAAKTSVVGGDVLTDKEIEQWVMKRKSKGYKADSRWFRHSMFTDGNGCWATETVGWHVGTVADGLDITEKAMSRCGAPMAPVPAAVYAVYGDDYVILNCGWRRNTDIGGACPDKALDHLKYERTTQATFVIVDQEVEVRDRLYGGSYIGFIVATAELTKDGTIKFSTELSRLITTRSIFITDPGCKVSAETSEEAEGFVIVRSGGVLRARAYRWMDCPVY